MILQLMTYKLASNEIPLLVYLQTLQYRSHLVLMFYQIPDKQISFSVKSISSFIF